MSTKNTQIVHNQTNNKKNEESDSNTLTLVKKNIFGVGLTNETEENILEYIVKNLPKQQNPYYIVTPNPEILLYANTHPEFRAILNNAKIALTDGMQLFRAAQILGQPLKERIIGTDFVENLCEKVANRPITVGFLGAGPNVAEMAAECLRQKHPGLKVVFAQAEWEDNFRGRHKGTSFFEASPAARQSQKAHRLLSFTTENFRVPRLSSKRTSSLRLVRSASRVTPSSKIKYPTSTIDILFVAFGFPKQEEWMAKHLGKIPVKVMMGVGGALDQIVNPSLRPPQFIHTLGMGWLYRLVREPWRVKRQVKLLEFVGMVAKKKFTQK